MRLSVSTVRKVLFPDMAYRMGHMRGNERLREHMMQRIFEVRCPWEEGPCQEADHACVYWAKRV